MLWVLEESVSFYSRGRIYWRAEGWGKYMGVEEDARRISVAVPQGRNDECLNQGSGNGGGEEGKRAPGS